MARLEMILAMMGVLLLSCAVVPTSSFVLGIDVGAEFMKVALVQPGRPIELVTNVESKRKTQMIVGFNGDERIYGGSALNYLPRKPDRVFTGMRMMLGRSVDRRGPCSQAGLAPPIWAGAPTFRSFMNMALGLPPLAAPPKLQPGGGAGFLARR